MPNYLDLSANASISVSALLGQRNTPKKEPAQPLSDQRLSECKEDKDGGNN